MSDKRSYSIRPTISHVPHDMNCRTTWNPIYPAIVQVGIVEVAQGYVEESTVNAVAAMVDLISLQRGFQAQLKGIEHYKQMDSAAIGLLRRF